MDMPMPLGKNRNEIEVITGVERRRRWSAQEKLQWLKRTMEPGMTVSSVAREAGITASQLFQWRKAYTEGSLVAVGANEPVVPASDLQDAVKRIRQLEAALGRKTLENEILKEAVEFAKAKSGLRAHQYCRRTTSETGLFCSGSGAQSCRCKENSTRHLGGPAQG